MTFAWSRWLHRIVENLKRHHPHNPKPRNFCPTVESLEAREVPANFFVKNTNPTGDDSLFKAIDDSNKSKQDPVNEIFFEIGNVGTEQTIKVQSGSLLTITRPVIINGHSQGGKDYKGLPLITIDGSNAGTAASGLEILASGIGSTVKGLTIVKFSYAGISLRVNQSDIPQIPEGAQNIIQGNIIGTDKKNSPGLGNREGIFVVGGRYNLIGGSTDDQRNTISGNTQNGIWLGSSDINSAANHIRGNYIGIGIEKTDTGVKTIRVPNIKDGIRIEHGTSNTIGSYNENDRNFISGNNGNGITIYGQPSKNNYVLSNYIGTDITGESAVGNDGVGISIYTASDNYIGGDQFGLQTDAESHVGGNLISGNRKGGITISNKQAKGNVVVSNYIGTNRNGMTRIANEGDGVLIDNAPGTWLYNGDVKSKVSNIISGNSGNGVHIRGAEAKGTLIFLNRIGTKGNGIEKLGNDGNGILIDGAPSNEIGFEFDGFRNTISGNGKNGIEIKGANASDNLILRNNIGTDKDGHKDSTKALNLGNGVNGILIGEGVSGTKVKEDQIAYNGEKGVKVKGTRTKVADPNSIFSNGGLGIDTDLDGVTLVGVPVITSATVSGTNLTVQGYLNSTPNRTFLLEFFHNSALDEAGYGEGEIFIYSNSVTTNSSGFASIAFTFAPASLSASAVNNLTATSTDTSTDGSSSEFSRAIRVYNPNTVGDRVWTDLNANGTWDPYEPGRSGVTVSLYDGTGMFLSSMPTDADGYYLFSSLAAGTYSVGFTAPAGTFFSPKDVGSDDTIDSDADLVTGRTANFTLAAGESNPNLDTGLYEKGTIADRVWEDANGNGLQDATEVGRFDVTVQLLNSVGAVLATATTNASGLYSFPNLVPATYAIKVLVPAGRGFASRDCGTNDQIDSDVDSTGQTAPFNLTSGQNDTSRDAGLTRLSVTSFTPTSTGFIIDFDRLLVVEALNLYYTQAGGFGPADVTLVGNSVGAIKGSLVINPPTDVPLLDSGSVFSRITFIRTGDVLPADTYTVTLRSASDGFRAGLSGLLDGNNDGTLGDNYVTNFTVAASSAVVVSLPDFARGAGQPIDVPATSTGLPLRLSDGANVTSVALTIYYDPTLLTITGAAVASGVPAGASVTLDTTVAGRAVVNFSSPTALSAGALDFVKLTATVPTTASYKGKHVLDITSISINGGAIASRDNDALHVAAYFGDTTGNKAYSALDAQRVSRVVVDLDTGFAAYRSLDPVIIADITGSGDLSGLDSARIMQESVGLDRLEIPPIPAGVIPDPATGPDPYLNIPTAYSALPGQTVTVAVNLDLSDGLNSLDLAISYDTSRLEVLSVNDIVRGILTYDFGLFTVNLDNPAGVIRVSMARTEGEITGRGSGSLLQITFRVKDGAPTGGAIINLRQSSGGTITQLNEGGLDLMPDPSDTLGDELDGLITVL